MEIEIYRCLVCDEHFEDFEELGLCPKCGSACLVIASLRELNNSRETNISSNKEKIPL